VWSGSGKRWLLLAALLIAGCRGDADRLASQARAEVRAALARYNDLVARMDSRGIAAMYTEDGEISEPGQPVTVGRDSIRAFLDSFAGFHVEENAMTSDTIVVKGASLVQSGRFSQRVRMPDGTEVRPHGSFTAEWVHESDGQWRIRRIHSVPDPIERK
jgi:uncharacterized protein (TIGR02246 family)